MKIRRVHLLNFRQHADTEIELGDGITGVIGPNGSGKTTLLEAIAWAIYGPPAVRGDRDSIRNLHAKPRSSVRVELEFELGRHTYRVVRGLHTAELYEDGRLLANAIKEVTDKLGRTLGMTHDEFFNTYFTGQKELAVMASLGKTERAAFLSRVLGYERLRLAQEKAREVRNALAAELRGLEAGLSDRAALETERGRTGRRVAAARAAHGAAAEHRAEAERRLRAEEPRWNAWVARRERTMALDGERRMADHAVEAGRQECQRLDRELAEALHAREQLRRLQSELEPIERLKGELATLERLQREEAARRADVAQREELRRGLAAVEARIAEIAAAASELATAETVSRELEAQAAAAERLVEDERTAWVRDRQDAETKRLALREQYREVKEQRELILRLGPEGTCPTCKRPLGAEYEAVLQLLDRQLEDITINGGYFKQRVDQLADPPVQLRALEAERDRLVAELGQAHERAGTLRARAAERERLEAELAAGRGRVAELEGRIASRATGYDAGRHDAVRAALAKLEPVALEAAGFAARAARAEVLVGEAELAERALSTHEERASQLRAAIAAEGFSERGYQAARERHDRALGGLRDAELAVVEARGELVRAEEFLQEAERRERERAEREHQIVELKRRGRVHHELDRAFSDLRAELNAALRPEIAELASGFLADLTDGRYDEVDLNENYETTVLEDGVPKTVVSGGEEDLSNLVLRLAISQMIAERAGQPLSLLVLDEIFGALDDSRRQSVLRLLRRLGDRFPQVILITHVEQVREGLDRVLRVEYDASRATSLVRDETPTLGGTDAGVAA
ncbi:MAG TPA: SMC family ATPase [Gemmatimonadales bacterium]